MSEYERLSLRLLAVIASGINLLALSLVASERQDEHKAAILLWQMSLQNVTAAVSAAINQDEAADQKTLGTGPS